MAQYDDLNTRQIWIVGILSVVLTAITILAVQVLYYALLTRHEQLVSERSDYSEGNGYITTQTQWISSYGRDPETGEVRIPIQTAIDLMVEEKATIIPAPKRETNENEEPTENGNDEA